MPNVSSLTLNYDAVLATTLFNLHKSGAIQDQISTANAFFHLLIKRGNYTADAEGNRMQVNLMYALNGGDSYAGYDVLDQSPFDGITAAFFDWGQWSVPISISGKEKRENASSATQAANLLKAKTKQSLMGVQESFAKAFLQGNGANTATAIATAFTSIANGSVFIAPLPLLVKFNPAAAVTVGNIAQGTYSWWRNQTKTSTATTFAAFLKELDNLHNKCLKGIGGKPNIHLLDQSVYELYVAALRNQNRYVETKQADIPFDNVLFHGSPVTWDEFVPDAQNETITGIPVAASGTWYMLNTDFFHIKTFLDFEATTFKQPDGQDAQTAFLLWHGGSGVSNRRKHGVMGAISTTISS